MQTIPFMIKLFLLRLVVSAHSSRYYAAPQLKFFLKISPLRCFYRYSALIVTMFAQLNSVHSETARSIGTTSKDSSPEIRKHRQNAASSKLHNSTIVF